MKQRTAQRLAKLYPAKWRARFGPEFEHLLEAENWGPRVLLDVVRAAFAERLLNLSGLETDAMTAYPATVLALARRPSGFIPVLMSLGAFAVVFLSISIVGAVRQRDEGTAAHLFQLLIVGELPVMGYFIVRGFREHLRAALTIFAVQVAGIALALFPVWYFGL